jgi:hypothetical protein
VRATTKFEIFCDTLTSIRERLNVMELQKACLAAPALRSNERTSTGITPPDFPLHTRRDMTRLSFRLTGRSRTCCAGELVLFQRQQFAQRAVKDDGDFADCPQAAFSSINAAVAAATPGDKMHGDLRGVGAGR